MGSCIELTKFCIRIMMGVRVSRLLMHANR